MNNTFRWLLLVFACSPYSDWFFRYLLVTLIGMALSTCLCKLIFNDCFFWGSVVLFLIMMYCIPVFGTSELAVPFVLGYIGKHLNSPGKAVNSNIIVQILLILGLFGLGLWFFYLAFYANGNTLHYTFYETSVFDLINEGAWYIFAFRQMCAICLSYAFILIIKKVSKKYSWFSYWGARTLPIYGIHVVFIIVLDRFLKTLDLSSIGMLGASLMLGLTVATLTIIVVSVIQKCLIGRVVIMGLSK